MTFRYFLIVSIFCLSVIASGSPSVPPHLELTLHEVYPSPICTIGSGNRPQDSLSTVTLIAEGVGDPVPVEVVFSIDYSGSMTWNDSNNKRINATKKFVSHLEPSRDKAGLVIWNKAVNKSALVKLTNNFEEINSILDMNISPELGTNFDAALTDSINLFSNSDDDVKRCIIFLSDGLPEPDTTYIPPNNPESQATIAKEKGIEIWTVGYTIEQKGEIILKEIANNTRGQYYRANSSDIENVFLEIYRNMTSLAGKDITVEYLAPADLLYSIDYNHIEGDNKVFVWNPRDLYIGDKWIKTFKVSSENPGWFTLGRSPSAP